MVSVGYSSISIYIFGMVIYNLSWLIYIVFTAVRLNIVMMLNRNSCYQSGMHEDLPINKMLFNEEENIIESICHMSCILICFLSLFDTYRITKTVE